MSKKEEYEVMEVKNPPLKPIKKIAAAIVKVQSEIHNPSNTATNPFFKSKYAPLSEILKEIRPLLAKHGLATFQEAAGDGDHVCIKTHLLHESGESISTNWLRVRPDKGTAQGAGSAITYLRRYQLSALLNISSEDDDDGNAAEPSKPTKQVKVKKGTTPQRKAAPKKETVTDEDVLAPGKIDVLTSEYPVTRAVLKNLKNDGKAFTANNILAEMKGNKKYSSTAVQRIADELGVKL